jgi:hypothetical protein
MLKNESALITDGDEGNKNRLARANLFLGTTLHYFPNFKSMAQTVYCTMSCAGVAPSTTVCGFINLQYLGEY